MYVHHVHWLFIQSHFSYFNWQLDFCVTNGNWADNKSWSARSVKTDLTTVHIGQFNGISWYFVCMCVCISFSTNIFSLSHRLFSLFPCHFTLLGKCQLIWNDRKSIECLSKYRNGRAQDNNDCFRNGLWQKSHTKSNEIHCLHFTRWKGNTLKYSGQPDDGWNRNKANNHFRFANIILHIFKPSIGSSSLFFPEEIY